MGRPYLLFFFSGLEADAPEKNRVIYEQAGDEREGTRVRARFEIEHPGAPGRALLAALPPVLERYGLDAVGLVPGSNRLQRMEQAFPGIVFLDVGNPPLYLRYWETGLWRGFYIEKGRVREFFMWMPFDLGFFAPLESLLASWRTGR